MNAFAGAVLALGLLDSLLLGVLALRRLRLARAELRRTEAGKRLRPLVLAFVEGDADLPDDLSDKDRELIADILASYGRLVRGPARERISDYFDRHGLVARELQALDGDRSAWRRAAAAYRLGDIATLSAEQGLIAGLDDPSREVRTAATRSLGRLGSVAAVSPLIAAVAAGRVPTALARWAALQVGAPALPELRKLLESTDSARRAGALMLIGLLGDATDSEMVETRLRDTSAEVRAESARALGRLGGSRSAGRLVLALDDRMPAVREAAAASLGRLRADALGKLLELAQNDLFDVARSAARSAASIDLDRTAAAAEISSSPAHLLEAVDEARLG